MTTQESFKRRIRARMAKTGERYSAARRSLLAQGDTRPSNGWVSQPDTSDEVLRRATGRGWDEWCELIDRSPVRDSGHTRIAAHVEASFGVNGWWAQSITVGYERIRGLRLPHQNNDGTFTANRSKTIAVDAVALRAALLDEDGRSVLFPASATELRSRPASKVVRIDLGSGRAEITLTSAPGDRTKVTIAHSKLPTADDVAIWKEFWAEWIDALDEA